MKGCLRIDAVTDTSNFVQISKCLRAYIHFDDDRCTMGSLSFKIGYLVNAFSPSTAT